MELETIEKDDRLVVDMSQNHTLANLIRKAIWESGGEAGYDKGHPLDEESMLVVSGDNPEEVLEDAIEQAREWLDDIEAEA